MPSSLFEKRKPVRDGPKKVPLADRVSDMDTKTIQTKHANTRRKATESSGAALTGHLANLWRKFPLSAPTFRLKSKSSQGKTMPFVGYAYESGRKCSKGSSTTERNSRPVTNPQTDGMPSPEEPKRLSMEILPGECRQLASLAGIGSGVTDDGNL